MRISSLAGAALLMVLLPLFTCAVWASTPPVVSSLGVQATPALADVLSPDGTLRTGSSGSFDPAGYRLRVAPDGKPVFQPVGVAGPGDEQWQDGFGLKGVNGRIYAVASSGTDIYVGGLFTTAGNIVANNIAKWDGTRWSNLGLGVTSADFDGGVRALAVNGHTLYVGGRLTAAGGLPVNNIAKWDGTTWSSLGTGTNDIVNALAVSGTDLYVGGVFTTAGGITVNSIAKWNGTQWSSMGTGTSGHVTALAIMDNDLYVGGGGFKVTGTHNSIVKWDGTGWSSLGPEMKMYNVVYSMAVSNHTLYIGGRFSEVGGVAISNIAQWDGTTWSSLGTGLTEGVLALVVHNNALYAGGYFYRTGGVNTLAQWDGATWRSIGNGINGTVSALAVSNGKLYAGGNFTTAGSIVANNIATWDSVTWSNLGTGKGMSGTVRALAVSGTDVYAAGQFTTAGGVVANNIAKWDGTQWTTLGTGIVLDGPIASVRALAVSGHDLYVGGSFLMAGGVSASYIAKWDGTSWSSLGTGMNGPVLALVINGGELYAAGSFTTAGGVVANNIAKWNGTRWSSLGTGVDNMVTALTLSGGDVYVGGTFTTAGGMAASKVAKWDGTRWSPLGMGVDRFGVVISMAASGPNVYVGGVFTSAGGVAVNHIAKWDGVGWSNLGTGVNVTGANGSGLYALTANGPNIYAGGTFTTAGGVTVNHVAKWDGTRWSSLGTGLNDFVKALAMSGSKVYAGGDFTGVGDGSKATVHFGVYESTSSGPLAAATAHAAALRLIPNPARNSATLTLPATSQRRRVQLLDALGRQVQTTVVPAQSVTVVLDLRGLPAGLYTVRCESASCSLMVE